MLWVLLRALGISIAESAGLSPSEKGLMVAVPVLTGSLLRIPLGILGDRLGGKPVGDMWWFFLLYSVTFGGYVGLSSFLPLFLRDQYALGPVSAA